MGSRILVVTPDVLAPRMAGPAIRAFTIARHLHEDTAGHRVTLVSTTECSISDERFQVRYVPWLKLASFARDFDVLILQGFASYHAPGVLNGDQVIVFDWYDPLHFEQLEQLDQLDPEVRTVTLDLTTRVLNEQAVRGDFFVCASEEQRHLWLGLLGAFGRVNPLTYGEDPALRSLIDLCPFGLDAEPPVHRKPAVRRVVDGIGPDDKVILWAGGVYNWFDPLTLLDAVADLSTRHTDVRLFFMGMAHPNADVDEMAMPARTRARAAELGLTGKHVFFNDGWVAFDERANYLLEADVGVSTHFDRAETVFAFRTRILDYLWAGLPVVATDGDSFGRLIRSSGLGVAVPEKDPKALAEALERTLYDAGFAQECRANVASVRHEFTWESSLGPLIAFCRNPRRAADAAIDQRRFARRPVPPAHRTTRALMRARELQKAGSMGLVVERLRARAARRRAR